MEQQSRELDSWTKIVKKTVHAKAQASLQPALNVKDMDQQCLRGNRPNSTKASTQGNFMKDPRVDEPKARPQEARP